MRVRKKRARSSRWVCWMCIYGSGGVSPRQWKREEWEDRYILRIDLSPHASSVFRPRSPGMAIVGGQRVGFVAGMDLSTTVLGRAVRGRVEGGEEGAKEAFGALFLVGEGASLVGGGGGGGSGGGDGGGRVGHGQFFLEGCVCEKNGWSRVVLT